MDTETVCAQLLPQVAAPLRTTLDSLAEQERPSVYPLEEGMQAVLPHSGQVLLQAVAEAQRSGLVGPERVSGRSHVLRLRSSPHFAVWIDRDGGIQ